MGDKYKRNEYLDEAANQYANLVSKLYNEISRMDEQSLNDLSESIESLSQTNCWCMTYHIGSEIKFAVNDALRIIEQRKEEALKQPDTED